MKGLCTNVNATTRDRRTAKGKNTLQSLINTVVRVCSVNGVAIINAKVVEGGDKANFFLIKREHTGNVVKKKFSFIRHVFH